MHNIYISCIFYAQKNHGLSHYLITLLNHSINSNKNLMALGLTNREISEFDSIKKIQEIIGGKSADYVIKSAFQSKENNKVIVFIQSLAVLFSSNSGEYQPEHYYKIIYSEGSPYWMTIDIDYRKSEYEVIRLSKNEFYWNQLYYKYSGGFIR